MQFDEVYDIKGHTQRRMVKKRRAATDTQKLGAPSKKQKSVSFGFVFSPTWTGRMVVVTNQCSTKTTDLINSVLGDHVKLIANANGILNGTTHAKEFPPN